ncbi:MAG: hypothetical protein H6600_10170 [Flavobacteriales bacterium]|nr:hypothetical protein [Flavobacteriales bacterium]MCB9195761.1 hypothetical protein [Flavobacteriales bacterium]MCB9198815.1 hypothetical protein [Flavobacteriales bacterium]
MKKVNYTLLAVALLAVSCEKEETSENTESMAVTKEVKAEIINGETTVTITTTEDGKTTTEIISGDEAEKYLKEEKLDGSDAPEGSKVIVKKMDHSVNIELDIDEILNDPELQDLDEETREKVKNALENAMENMDVDMDVEYSGDDMDHPVVKTKVMVIDED